MKLLSEEKALLELRRINSEYKELILEKYESRAKSCLTCGTPGACCQDEHFVNVHISRLEARAIHRVLGSLAEEHRERVYKRIAAAVDAYGLEGEEDTFSKTFACPLYEKGAGCLVHFGDKPVACITHACYDKPEDLPPDELQFEQERRIDRLNTRTYGGQQLPVPLPLALDIK